MKFNENQKKFFALLGVGAAAAYWYIYLRKDESETTATMQAGSQSGTGQLPGNGLPFLNASGSEPPVHKQSGSDDGQITECKRLLAELLAIRDEARKHPNDPHYQRKAEEIYIEIQRKCKRHINNNFEGYKNCNGGCSGCASFNGSDGGCNDDRVQLDKVLARIEFLKKNHSGISQDELTRLYAYEKMLIKKLHSGC